MFLAELFSIIFPLAIGISMTYDAVCRAKDRAHEKDV
jgi:hypothetical protein